jgi:hypothetical protein
MLLEVFLIRIHHAVKPWQKLLCAVISVEDDGDTIGWCDRTDVVSGCDSSSNRRRLVFVVNAFSGKISCAALRGL